MNQRIKLTDAQQELIQEHFPIWPAEHVTHIDIESPEHLAELTTAIAELSAELDARPYSPEIARSKFAAKYLLRKLEAFTQEPTPPPPATLTLDMLEPGAMVHLVDDPNQVFKVIKPNLDGSVQVFGGDTSYRMYRDFPIHRLAAHTPKSVPPR